MNLYRLFLKRTFDIIIATLATIILSPILLILAILVRIKLGSPIIFKQDRPGKKEKIFYLYKFRSMTNETDEDGKLLPDNLRITKFGRILRSTSLDELPELFNIIKGDMSIVGPRPLSFDYLPYYSTLERIRHEVRPGLTGLAQINGRNNLPWEGRFALDIEYVKNISFINDLKIIIYTILKVFKGSDVVVRDSNPLKSFNVYRNVSSEFSSIPIKKQNIFKEIGGFYWIEDDMESEKPESENILNKLPKMEDSSFTFSGRNAIKLAIEDFLNNHTLKNVYIPSFCCNGMLQPFVQYGIKTKFYDIKLENGKFVYNLPKINKGDIFVIMSYFGLNNADELEAIKIIKGKGGIVIEDITHSLLKNISFSSESDYLVASLRKWMAIPTGGWIGKRGGKLIMTPHQDSNHAVKDNIYGMKEKCDYLKGNKEDKDFLIKLARFDTGIVKIEKEYKIDDLSFKILHSININEIIEKRKNNSKILIKGLKDLSLSFIEIPNIDFSKDVPIFIPIFLDKEERDSLHNYLQNNGIYCPIHWSEILGASSDIKERELSLVCDQRYSETDMKIILGTIIEWIEINNFKK